MLPLTSSLSYRDPSREVVLRVEAIVEKEARVSKQSGWAWGICRTPALVLLSEDIRRTVLARRAEHYCMKSGRIIWLGAAGGGDPQQDHCDDSPGCARHTFHPQAAEGELALCDGRLISLVTRYMLHATGWADMSVICMHRTMFGSSKTMPSTSSMCPLEASSCSSRWWLCLHAAAVCSEPSGLASAGTGAQYICGGLLPMLTCGGCSVPGMCSRLFWPSSEWGRCWVLQVPPAPVLLDRHICAAGDPGAFSCKVRACAYWRPAVVSQ
jgi:hypothetical protein